MISKQQKPRLRWQAGLLFYLVLHYCVRLLVPDYMRKPPEA